MDGYVKTCSVCGSDFEAGENEPACRFRERRTCGARSCRVTLRQVNRIVAEAHQAERWARDPMPVIRQGAAMPGKRPTSEAW